MIVRDKQRMKKYKIFSVAFSYPEEDFFNFFPGHRKEKKDLIRQYDNLFRNRGIWLYITEYLAEHDFQKSNYLSDIMGFYKAFGIKVDRKRPDSLSCVLEFMYYLILKTVYAAENKKLSKKEDKISVCADAQKKFFKKYVYSGSLPIIEKITKNAKGSFYAQKCKKLKGFLEYEDKKIDNLYS